MLPRKKKEKKRVGRNESEEEGLSSECISHSMVLQCVGTTRLHGSERVRIQ
jgi:hypothetical protein